MINILYIPKTKNKLKREDVEDINASLINIPGHVIEIASHTFNGKINIKKVILKEGVKKLRAYSFANCINLEEVIIPLSLEEIHPSAFDGCNKLDVENLNNQLTSNIVRKVNKIITNPNQTNFDLFEKLAELNKVISVSSRVYGEYPSNLISPEDIKTLSEYGIFLKLLEIETQKLTEVNIASIQEIDYAISYLKKQLRKFNVPISDDEINNPSTMTENYNSWLSYWYEYQNKISKRTLKPKK